MSDAREVPENPHISDALAASSGMSTAWVVGPIRPLFFVFYFCALALSIFNVFSDSPPSIMAFTSASDDKPGSSRPKLSYTVPVLPRISRYS